MTKETESPQTIKAWKITISGSYRTSKKEYIDFQEVVGTIPETPSEEYALAMVRKRYAVMWVSKDPKYKERVVTLREAFIDKIEKVDAEFSFLGKEIRDLTYEELQDLATFKGLRAIPLYKKGGLRQAQIIAYAAFSEKVLGIEVDYKEVGFVFMDQPKIFVDSGTEFNIVAGMTNDEVLEQEQANTSTQKTVLDRAQLEKIAHDRDITFNKAISDEKLHAKIFTA
ncbi:MAG: hypothetical protein V3U75_13370 [Methylococcaceae bacterium]